MGKEAKRIERELPVPLSDKAIEARAQELAGLVNEQTAIETELAAYGADKRKRLREIKKEVKRLASAIHDKCELAMVQCSEERLFDQNRLLVRRLDSHVIVEDRALSGEERQLEIDGAAGKKTRLPKEAPAAAPEH